MPSNVIPDPDLLPPPPYTAHDDFPPSLPPTRGATSSSIPATLAIRTSIRGGYIRHTPFAGDPVFTSAETYFEERPCTIPHPGSVLNYHVSIPADVARGSLPFPEPANEYRARDVTTADWCTFVNYLLPTPQDGLDKPGKQRQDEEKSP